MQISKELNKQMGGIGESIIKEMLGFVDFWLMLKHMPKNR